MSAKMNTFGSGKWDILQVTDMIQAVNTDMNYDKLYYSKNESEPCIEMVFRDDKGFVAFQSSVSKTHKDQI
jgi:hypothetical protein